MFLSPWPSRSAKSPKKRAPPHPGQLGGKQLSLQASSMAIQETPGSDSKAAPTPTPTRKFQAGTKPPWPFILLSAPGSIASACSYPHAYIPVWTELKRPRVIK